MNKITALLVALLTLGGMTAQVRAEEMKKCLVVWGLTDQVPEGKYERYSLFLEYNPHIQVRNGYIEIRADERYEYKYSEYESYWYDYWYSIDIKRSDEYTFTIEERPYSGYKYDYEDAIGDVTQDKRTAPSFRLVGSQLQVMGLKPGSAVQAYGVGGEILSQATASEGGQAMLNLPQAKGIVIVKTNDITIRLQAK